MESGRHRFYGVRRGRVPGIYTNWEDCKRQVNGFRDCEFKGFPNANEAENWLHAGGVLLEPPPAPHRPLPPSPPWLGLLGSSMIVGGSSLLTQLHAMQVQSGHRTQVEAGCGRSRNDSTLKGRQGSCRRYRGADFVITEDMEVYLIRVCSQLHLEYPVFTRRKSYSQNGAQLHGFWVVLQSAQHGVNWVVLMMTTREICDYNIKKVAALLKRIEDLEKYVLTPPYHRIRELQDENQMMGHELDMFNKMFDD
ncbi:hypothetical protein AHAS_Ahas10G0083200 [Arachis hypogaea]